MFRIEIVCDHSEHGERPRVIDSFKYDAHRDTGAEQWFWENSRKVGGGKQDHQTGLRDWMERSPSHRTVREDFADGIPRLRLRCKGHADIGMAWPEFVSRYLDPGRENGVTTIPVRVIVSARTQPTHRRGDTRPYMG